VDETAVLIFDIGFVLLLAAVAGWIARRIGLPDVLGYLVVGILVNPTTPGFVAEPREIAVLADIGVILLLFQVGLEMDLRRVRREAGALFWAVPVQVLVTLAVSAAAIALIFGVAPVPALILGLAVASSSSAVIAAMSGDGPGSDPSLRTALGWSGLQDVVAVVLAAFLFSVDGIDDLPLPAALAGLAVYALAVVIVARVLPRFLRAFADDDAAFLVVSLGVGVTLAGLGAILFAVPVALAAFVAGLAISETAETTELGRRLLPFRSVFAVFFFVSIGFLFDPSFIAPAAPIVVLLVLLVVGKSVLIAALARIAKLPGRPVAVGTALGQMGEFGFVLAAALAGAKEIGEPTFAAVVSTVAITIAASTILLRLFGDRASPDVVVEGWPGEAGGAGIGVAEEA
jgi:monovalent cation:H+ antiporter-2, CPA2 family